jgi:hypothetical protein
MNKSVLSFYLWAYDNHENVDYILGEMRKHYPDSDLYISSDNGYDFSKIAESYNAIHYNHGNTSHGYPQSKERYGWTSAQANLWLARLYEACCCISTDFVMMMEEDILIKERFKFPAMDIVMIPNIKNAISKCGMDWVKRRGGNYTYPYYSAGGGTIINRKKFIQSYEKHIDSLMEEYENLYAESMKEGAIGWGWNDSLLAVLMYAGGATISTELPILETGNENDPAPIIHKFKKYYNKKVAVITSIYGNYEATCKKFAAQTVPVDFICFTNIENIKSNGWTINTTPYHSLNPCSLDNGTQINSLSNNKHTFNIAKYYKQSWHNIPILKDYDVVIWVDGTIEITNPNTVYDILQNIDEYKIVGWEHYQRSGNLESEVIASNFERYTSTFWFGQSQPYQDIFAQYDSYVKDGYDENYWSTVERQIGKGTTNFGVWLTCFIAFKNCSAVNNFLDIWYEQTLNYTTQDQIGFPMAVRKSNIIPYTYPDRNVLGHADNNYHYFKHMHGK